MRVHAFSFVRNAVRFDYPVVESYSSVLPLVDAFFVAHGNSEDETEKLLESIKSPKLHIFNTVWDDTLREGGRVLAVETDKALQKAAENADWLIYIQADELMHEKDYPLIRAAMEKYWKDPEVEGLLFQYTHFYGHYHYVADSRTWYRHEIRILKNLPNIHSYRDAQGFRIDDRKLKVVEIPARIYHYGWVKPPEKQQAKQQYFHRLWHDDRWMQENVPAVQAFDYSKIDSIVPFKGTHPASIKERIASADWSLKLDTSRKNFPFKKRLLYFLEQKTGLRLFEYKNYQLLKNRQWNQGNS